MKTRLLSACAVLVLPLLALAAPAAQAADSSPSQIGIQYAVGDNTSDRVFMSGKVSSANPACRKNRTLKLYSIAPDTTRTLIGKDSSGATNHWGFAVASDISFELALTAKKLPNGHLCKGVKVQPLIKLVFVAPPIFPKWGNTGLSFYKAATINSERFVVGAVASSKSRCVEGRTVRFQGWVNDEWRTVGTDKSAGTGDTFAIRAPSNTYERIVVMPRKVGSVKCARFVFSPGA